MFDYKRIIVVGCPGAGKSTFSRKLHQATKIELFHLDALYWKSNTSHITRPTLIRKQKKIFKRDSFIIDGNFKSTLELRLAQADLVFFFDLPVEDCIYGATHRKGNRPELPFELPDDEELVEFIKRFNTDVRPKMLELFEKYNSNVVTFTSRQQADDYITELKKSTSPDLTLKTESGYFNHRVAAVIICDNKLLAQKNTKDNSYYLVGGRVRFGESSKDALVREIKEELGVTLTDLKPIWINECFFDDDGKSYHEIGIYYRVDLENTGFAHFEKTFETKESDRTNIYEWLSLDNLDGIMLYPQFIKNEIKKIDNLKLIITKEN